MGTVAEKGPLRPYPQEVAFSAQAITMMPAHTKWSVDLSISQKKLQLPMMGKTPHI